MISSLKYLTSKKSIISPFVCVPTSHRQVPVGFSYFALRQQTKRTMSSFVKHVVMFNFKEETSTDTIQAIQDGLLNLPKEIAFIKDYELGVDMLLESGQKNPAGKNRLLSWSCTFLNADDYESYCIHPIHVEFVNTLIKPNLLPGSRAAIQYQIKK